MGLHDARIVAASPARPLRVDPHDPEAVRFWCRRLACDVIALRDAAARVGLDPEALRRELRRPTDRQARPGGAFAPAA